MKRVLAALGLAALIAVLLLVGLQRGRDRGGVAGDGAQETGRTAGPAAGSEPSGERAQTAREEPGGSAPAEPPASGDALAPVVVRVVRAADRAPLAGAEVRLADGGQARTGTTDPAGEWRLDLAGTPWGPGTVVRAEAHRSRAIEFFHASEDECRLFRGSVVLAEEVVLLACDCELLGGRVVDGAGRPLAVRSVTAHEPRSGAMSVDVFLGRAPGRSDGRFAIPVCTRRPLASIRLELDLVDGQLSRSVSWSELASEEGALLRLELATLVVRVVDERGRPLAGATVRACPLPRGSSLPLESRTTTRGEVRHRLPAGPAGVCAGAEGRASAAHELELRAGDERTTELVLRALAPGETVTGSVRLAGGSPLPGALVTARPAGEAELRGVGMVQVETGADGRFRLPWDAEAALLLVAHARGHGLSREYFLDRGSREVELVLHAQGELGVELVPRGLAPEFGQGLVEYFLRERERGEGVSGHEFGVPFVIGELPAGHYDLWVLVNGWEAWAEGDARVDGGQRATARLAARPVRRARGSLRWPDGSPAGGIELRPLVSGWPEELRSLRTAVVRSDGRFELVLGTVEAAEVLPAAGGSPHAPFPIAAGAGQDFYLR